jgi:hypothetical protein
MYRRYILHVFDNVILILILKRSRIIISFILKDLSGDIWIEEFYGYLLFLIPFLSDLWLYHSCTHLLRKMMIYKKMIISGESRLSLITLGFYFFPCGIWLLISFWLEVNLFSVMDSILIFSNYRTLWNIALKSTSCVLCDIASNNSLPTMQYIEGRNQMDLKDFHFTYQMFWVCHWKYCEPAKWLHLLVDCRFWIIFLFDFHAIIDTLLHFLEEELNSPTLQMSTTPNWGHVWNKTLSWYYAAFLDGCF